MIICLIYIVSSKKYLEYYRKGIRKYTPLRIMPRFKAKIIEYYCDNKVVTMGINLKDINWNNNNDVKKFIEELNKIKTKEATRIYIEEQESISKEVLTQISEETNLLVFHGEDIKINILPEIIGKIFHNIKEELVRKEILILSDDKERVLKTIKAISKNLMLISQAGCTTEEEKQIYDYILEEYGISLFFPNNVEKIINNYSIIINFLDKISFDISKIRKNSIVFNFSKDNKFWEDKGIPTIRDFVFKVKDFQVNTALYEALDIGKYEGDIELYINKNNYNLKKYIKLYLKIKGQF